MISLSIIYCRFRRRYFWSMLDPFCVDRDGRAKNEIFSPPVQRFVHCRF